MENPIQFTAAPDDPEAPKPERRGPRIIPDFLEANFDTAIGLDGELRIRRAPWWLRWLCPHVIR